MSWCLEALKKYAVFSGRSRRKEYWYFVLFSSIVSIVLTAIESLVGAYVSYAGVSLGLLSWGYTLATIVPIVALSVRRLHDVDRSGWWILAVFVPLIGLIALIGYALLDGTPGDNRYGPDPKGTAAGAV